MRNRENGWRENLNSNVVALIRNLDHCESGQAKTEYAILLAAFMMAFVTIPDLVMRALLRYYQPYAFLLSLPFP